MWTDVGLGVGRVEGGEKTRVSVHRSGKDGHAPSRRGKVTFGALPRTRRACDHQRLTLLHAMISHAVVVEQIVPPSQQHVYTPWHLLLRASSSDSVRGHPTLPQAQAHEAQARPQSEDGRDRYVGFAEAAEAAKVPKLQLLTGTQHSTGAITSTRRPIDPAYHLERLHDRHIPVLRGMSFAPPRAVGPSTSSASTSSIRTCRRAVILR